MACAGALTPPTLHASMTPSIDPAGATLATAELPVLESARLRLRSLCRDDVEALYVLFADPEITRFWSAAAMTSVADAEALLAEIAAEQARGELLEWALERREEPGLIGTCSLGNVDLANRRAEIGFALTRSAWGQGYMAEILPVLVQYAFEDLGLHRLEADIDPRNAASIRLIEGLGFQLEGRLRQRWQVTGEVQDSLFYGLLAPEWRAGHAMTR